MIITRTPFRISFFGGGTDFPSWYKENAGAVLSTTIDKYCYISCRRLPPFFEHKHRIVYSKSELINTIDEIMHPAVREAFRFMKIKEGLEVHHDGDLPARSGIGSSSAFTVGLLHALYAFQGKLVSKKKLALDAIHVEQDMIKENVGSQDQVIAAFGGLNRISFSGNHNIEVTPIAMTLDRLRLFQNHLLLFFTGLTRTAAKIEKEKIKKFKNKIDELKTLHSFVDESINIINSRGNILDFGKLLHESWKIKRSLSDKVSNPIIEDIYRSAIRSGAIGGKVLGAGGGGFVLFFVRPQDRNKIIRTLRPMLYVPFHFETLGSQVIYYSQSGV